MKGFIFHDEFNAKMLGLPFLHNYQVSITYTYAGIYASV